MPRQPPSKQAQILRLRLQQSLLALVRCVLREICSNSLDHFSVVLHPAGNIAELLVASCLARVVDWHAGMLASSGGMERLRAAEKTAKEKRQYLYANAPAQASKTNGNTVNGFARTFDGTVVRVWSGDQISVVDKHTGKERRLQLSSTRAPR